MVRLCDHHISLRDSFAVIILVAVVLFDKNLKASPLTVTVWGRQKSVTVRGELLTVSLYPDIFIV